MHRTSGIWARKFGIAVALGAGALAWTSSTSQRVLGDDPPAKAATPATQPAKTGFGVIQFEVTYNYDETPDLKDWVENTLKPVVQKWYPIILADLPSYGFNAPMKFSITFHDKGNGVAATGGTRITCDAPWFRGQLKKEKNEAAGAVVHELVHVAQQYGRARTRNRFPGWLTEGIADYIRWFKYEPVEVRPHPNYMGRGKPTSYTDAYRPTAAFLEWVCTNYDHEFVVKMNTAGREGTYTPDLWKDFTGKTVDELWAIYAKTLKGAPQN